MCIRSHFVFVFLLLVKIARRRGVLHYYSLAEKFSSIKQMLSAQLFEIFKRNWVNSFSLLFIRSRKSKHITIEIYGNWKKSKGTLTKSKKSSQILVFVGVFVMLLYRHLCNSKRIIINKRNHFHFSFNSFFICDCIPFTFCLHLPTFWA